MENWLEELTNWQKPNFGWVDGGGSAGSGFPPGRLAVKNQPRSGTITAVHRLRWVQVRFSDVISTYSHLLASPSARHGPGASRGNHSRGNLIV
jgi:hypothetical protein